MENAKRDENRVPTLLGVSSSDSTTPIAVYVDPTTHRMLVDSAAGSNLIVGTSTITSGTTTKVLYNNAGVVGEYTVSGSGSVAMTTSPVFTTPNIGSATGNVSGSAGTVANATFTTALTVNTGTVTLTGNVANSSVLTIGAGAVSVSGTNTGDNAANSSTMYIGTTQVALNRSSAALTLAGITLTTPDIGTPSAGTVTNLTGTASININGTVGATTPTTIVGTTIQANTGFVPDADDGAYLGTSSLGFADLFLATGGTLHFANTDWVATHTSGILTIGTGTLKISTPTNTATSVVTIDGTQTLTNKRVTPRISSATSYTTDTGTSIAGDTQDMFIVTAQAGALKFNNPTGTPTDGQKLVISVASSTTAARALTWDTAYGATTVALPTTTAATTATLTIGFIWSASKSLWQCVAVA